MDELYVLCCSGRVRRRTPLLFSSKARADERELCEFARFKAPHSVTFVKELPQTATDIYLFVIREPESGLNLSRHLATIRDVRAECPAAESPL
jgi:hypothetical protein